MEKVSTPDSFSFYKAAASVGWVGLVVLLAFQLTANWQWSLMMDDAAYIRYMPHISHLWDAFGKEVTNYWHMGRFYPVKYLANLLKFRYLPLSPALFHWFNLGLLALTIGLTSLAVTRLGPSSESRKQFSWYLCVAALAIAQRPLLDVIALNTIAEGWVILFLSIGLLFYRRSVLISRLAFLLCTLSKEPAVVVFAASALAEFYAARSGLRRRGAAAIRGALDVALFIVMLLIIRQAKNSGAYLDHYQLISFANVRPFIVGMIKCGIGLVPLAFLIGPSSLMASRPNPRPRVAPEELLTILFGLAYLLLVAPRGIAGYLLIPAAYSFLVAGLIRLHAMPEVISGRVKTMSVILLTLAMASSLWRYTRYVDAIDESSIVLRLLAFSSNPRVVVVNGMEAADAVGQIAQDYGTPVRGALLTTSDELLRLSKAGNPEIVLVELSGYFGPISEEILKTVRPATGWRAEIRERFYRVYFR